MTYGIYAIKDLKSGYLAPMTDLNDATAMRNFQNALCKKDEVMYTHGTDFELYKIGEYETDSGQITPVEKAFLLAGKDHYDLEDSVHR